jgi:hypothetical protein
MNKTIQGEFYCFKHKHISKIILRKGERPFCEECIKEQIERDTANILKE